MCVTLVQRRCIHVLQNLFWGLDIARSGNLVPRWDRSRTAGSFAGDSRFDQGNSPMHQGP